MDDFIPDKKILILMLAVSLLMPAHYFLLAAFPPEGYRFTGGAGSEDGARFFLMISPQFNYQNPWDTSGRTDVLHNPLFNSPALYVPAGLLLNIASSPLVVFSILRFVFSFLLLLVSYNIIKIFADEKYTNLTFLIFAFGSGIGGIIYILASFAFPDFFTTPFFAALYDVTRIGVNFMQSMDTAYWLAALFFGYLSLLLFTKGKYRLAGIALGVSALIHLTLGIGFIFLVLVYAVVYGKLREAIAALIISAPFAMTWLVLYVQEPFFFDWYKTSAVGSAFMPSLLIGLGATGIL